MTVLFVLLPFIRGAPPSRAVATPVDGRAPLEELRDELFAKLVALDFDRDIGKLDEDEYRLERDDLKRQAAAVLRLLDEVALTPDVRAGAGARAASGVATPAPSPVAGALCVVCGAEIRAGDRFCFACGQPLHTMDGVDDRAIDDAIERDVLALRRQRAARPAIVRVSGGRRGRAR